MRTHRKILELTVTAFCVAPYVAHAQAPTSSPRFDVASVKEVEWRQGAGGLHSDPGRIDYRQIGMKWLVFRAFDLPDYQIVWPAWVENTQGTYYDISATFPPDTTKQQLQLMLQGLLMDRFKLAFHHETRDMKVYALRISPNGLKIAKAANPRDDDHSGAYSAGFFVEDHLWHLSGKPPNAAPSDPSGLTISTFTDFFNGGSRLDRVLVDKTGLEGCYDIDFKLRPGDPTIFPERGSMPGIPDLLSGMEKQLGLKPERTTLPIAMMVIDHLEDVPTAN